MAGGSTGLAYQDLNPFITIRDKYTYNEGNPLLRPRFADNYELSYSYKGIVTTKFYYNSVQDYQADAILQQNQVFISTNTNLGRYISKGFNIDLEFNPLKWWNVSLYSEVVNNVYKGQLFSSEVNINSTQFYIVGYNQFDVSNGWSAQCSAFYITKRKVAQYDLNARSQTNAAIQKKILHNKGSLRLGIRDMFYSNFSSGSILDIPGATSNYKNKFDSRIVTLGFNYTFGNSANTPKKRDTGGAQSEQDRVRQ